MRVLGAGAGGCAVDSMHISHDGRWYAVSVERRPGPPVYRKGLVGEGAEDILDSADPVLAKALAAGLDG